ncbi:MAG: hypothetical protein P8X68_04255 [Desulfobacterales bacterium]
MLIVKEREAFFSTPQFFCGQLNPVRAKKRIQLEECPIASMQAKLNNEMLKVKLEKLGDVKCFLFSTKGLLCISMG